MSEENQFEDAIKKLKEAEDKRENKRKFDQTIDLIVNLREFEVKKHGFNIFVQLPFKFKKKKIAGFFERDNKLVDVIKKDDFVRYKEKKDIKKLVRDYDSFIASAKLMPAVATTFGRILGPVGKMPSPQLGILPNEDEKIVQGVLNKVDSSVRIVVKEPSIKVGVAKVSMEDKDIVENVIAVYHKILENLPKNKDNVRSVKIKFTMGKPVTVGLK